MIGTVGTVLTPTADRPTRVARVAVFTVFGLNGFLLAMWVVHIPLITDRTGVAKSTLGMFILLMAGAGIVGMRITGPLADRFGSRTLVAAAAIIMSAAVIGPGLATGPISLAIALACFGFGNGALDVSMNTQAVHVERAYGRPIMGAFHALFSGGGLLGSLLGAATLRAGWDMRITLGLAAIGGVALTLFVLPRLLRDTDTARAAERAADARILTEAVDDYAPRTATHGSSVMKDAEPDAPLAKHSEPGPPVVKDAEPRLPFAEDSPADTSAAKITDQREHNRKVLALALIAFSVLLAEGVAGDWSTLQLREHLGADAATAALAFGAFSVTMTAGRLAADRVSGVFGRVAVVRYGMLLSALGLALIMASPWIPLTLSGWALMGLGLSGSVPQIFTAAGNLGSDKAATDMSRVFSLGYLGLLAGPAVIGWLTAVIPLTTAMAVPLIAVLVCCRYAGVVAPEPTDRLRR
ncbi:MFS transporter [Nocardia ninae]|uniref:MFS transporter n=1 Tax=Nocardia ninae NBRC 108245 TaxID=1210091 RepID=A0A511MBB2_9NOCA|nr:MFS transporter [Nocardia ninae NBRC 108245]